MSFRTFMGSIGSAFKTGWNNGNIQKGMAATGMAAFTVGLTGNMIHDMKHSGSIFGGGCGCNSFGFGGGMNMFGCNSMNMFGNSPFSMMGGGMNMFGMNNMYGGMDMYGGMGMLNGMNGMGNNMAYQWGQMLRVQLESQQGMYSGMNNGIYNNFEVTDEMLDNIAPGHDFEDEGGIVVTDTVKGQEFDNGTDALKNESDAEAVVLSETKLSENRTSYINELSATAKSYISHMDTDENGYVSEDEFIEHEVEKTRTELEENGQEMNEMQETNLRNSLRIVFAQMDLNRSGKVDWKEMTSTMATYDAGGKALGTKGGDGKITASEYKSAQAKLSSANGSFGKTNWQNYKRLFGNPESE